MKFLKALIAFVAFAGVFLAFAAISANGNNIDGEVFQNVAIYPIIAALGLGLSILIYQLSDGDYLPIKGFVFLVIAMLVSVIGGLIAIVTLNGTTSYFLAFLKYGILPISLSACACIYVLIGYAKQGIFFEIILPIICAIVPGIVLVVLKNNDGAMIGASIGFSIAAVLVMVAFSLINKSYADGRWGRGSYRASSSNYRPSSSSSSFSSSYSGSSSKSSYSSSSSSSSSSYQTVPSGVSTSQVKSAVYGLRAQEPSSQPYVMGSITSVDARSSDGGYNFDVRLRIHLHVCTNNFGSETTEDYVRSCAQNVADRLVDKAMEKLDRLDVGYDIDTDISSD